jgi:NTE family protein
MSSARQTVPGKTALVLAGGGLTGAVYEIGTLRAIDDLLVDRTVNDFDIYVGTSAGALVAALLANGMSPETMLQSIAGASDVPAIAREDVFQFNYRDLLRFGTRFPRTAVGALSHYVRNLGDMHLFDLAWSLLEALPSGLYDNLALERYVWRVLKKFGGSNHFGDLTHDLHIIATDLDSSQRVVFSRDDHAQVPISLAVAASTAIPILYKPVRIGDRDYVDGGLRGNASLDLAVEHGARLIVCINPIVPYDNDDLKSIPFLGPDGGHLSEKGLASIANQVGRLSSHAGLHYHIKQLRRTHPEVDIILIEPSRRDYQMFFYNIMRYSARLIVARHGFETVSLKLAEDFASYEEMLARSGIRLSRRLLFEELNEIQQSDYNPVVIRRVLEARSFAYHRRRPGAPVGQLHRTLTELDQLLAEFAEPPVTSAAA